MNLIFVMSSSKMSKQFAFLVCKESTSWTLVDSSIMERFLVYPEIIRAESSVITNIAAKEVPRVEPPDMLVQLVPMMCLKLTVVSGTLVHRSGLTLLQDSLHSLLHFHLLIFEIEIQCIFNHCHM